MQSVTIGSLCEVPLQHFNVKCHYNLCICNNNNKWRDYSDTVYSDTGLSSSSAEMIQATEGIETQWLLD